MKLCRRCGQPLPSRRSIFCGEMCSAEFWKKKKKNSHCIVCQSSLPNGRGTYCSDQCMETATYTYKKSNHACVVCASPLPKKRWRFCSGKCQRKFFTAKQVLRNRKPKQNRNCDVCGSEFSILGSSNKKYCSRRCRQDNAGRTRKNNYRSTKVELTCHVCSADFVGFRNQKYCSKRCLRKSPGNLRRKIRRRVIVKNRYATDPEYRKKILLRTKQYAKTNPIIRIRASLRIRTRKMLTRNVRGISALVGCNSATLRTWLESQFKPGMGWDNYGTVWVIDHKIPLASFDLDNAAHRKVACHYTNLQPLTKKENQQKGASITDPQLHLMVSNIC